MLKIADLVEIIATPHGNAPEWVREKWVGCVFPNIGNTCGHVPILCRDVLPRQGRFGIIWHETAGYVIEQSTALQVLAVHAPDAAGWFESHGYPTSDGAFLFKPEHVRVITERDTRGKLLVWDDLEQSWRPS